MIAVNYSIYRLHRHGRHHRLLRDVLLTRDAMAEREILNQITLLTYYKHTVNQN